MGLGMNAVTIMVTWAGFGPFVALMTVTLWDNYSRTLVSKPWFPNPG